VGRGFVRGRLQSFRSGEHVPHAGGVVLVHLAAECLDEISTGHGTWNAEQDWGFYRLCNAQWGGAATHVKGCPGTNSRGVPVGARRSLMRTWHPREWPGGLERDVVVEVGGWPAPRRRRRRGRPPATLAGIAGLLRGPA